MDNKYFEKDKIVKKNIFKKKFYNVYQANFKENKNLSFKLNKNIKIGGRIISLKRIGKIIFGNLNRNNSIYQFCIKKDLINEELFTQSSFLSTGDIIGIKGKIMFSNNKTLTIFVQNFVILSNFLLTVPDKKKFVDSSNRKDRLLDLAFNIKYRKKFYNKFILLKYMREYLLKNDFLEVETPVLNKYIGGADANPFETFHNKLNKKLYLSISPELYLKKMIAIGFPKVFQIAKCFRNEGISNRHNPEFLMMEMYISFFNYKHMMNFVEKLLKFIYKKFSKTNILIFKNYKINFLSKWEKISFLMFLDKKITDFNILKIFKNNNKELMQKIINKYKIQHIIDKYENKMKQLSIYEKLYILFDELFSDTIIQPTFIIHQPTRFSGLAKKKNHYSAERAELYMGGFEVSNLYSELNNPFTQQDFFLTQEDKHRDKEFVKALKIGIPNTSGAGIGIDRINMIFQNLQNIKDSIIFPIYKDK
jgi:lysyl-tRNA synthetase, class II